MVYKLAPLGKTISMQIKLREVDAMKAVLTGVKNLR